MVNVARMGDNEKCI